MTDDPVAVQHDLTEYEVTLRVRKRADRRSIARWFEADHAYGPVKRLNIHRDMHSSNIPFRADEGEFIDVVTVEEAASDE